MDQEQILDSGPGREGSERPGSGLVEKSWGFWERDLFRRPEMWAQVLVLFSLATVIDQGLLSPATLPPTFYPALRPCTLGQRDKHYVPLLTLLRALPTVSPRSLKATPGPVRPALPHLQPLCLPHTKSLRSF